jgi:hypothetical protein
MVKPGRRLLRTILAVTRDLASLASSAMRSRAQLAAENLFLRKQLTLYVERRLRPRRADDATRIILASVSISNSLSGRDRKLDQVPAVGDPTHMMQIGRANRVCTSEGQRRVTLQ